MHAYQLKGEDMYASSSNFRISAHKSHVSMMQFVARKATIRIWSMTDIGVRLMSGESELTLYDQGILPLDSQRKSMENNAKTVYACMYVCVHVCVMCAFMPVLARVN